MQHPGDRPDRPPVWVRGGPPYYYQPQNPHRQDVTPEALRESVRRASDASTSSVSSGSPLSPTTSPLGSASFPAVPPSPAAQAAFREDQEHARASGAPSQFPIGQSTSQPMSNMPFGSSKPGTGAFSAGGSGVGVGQFPRRMSSGSYRNLMTQKRESGDENTMKRRESWREMSPSGQKFYQRWWDAYTKGKLSKGNE